MPGDTLGELVRGQWIPSTYHSESHGEVVAEIGFRLASYVRENPGWTATMGESGMKLEHSPDTLLGSDIAVIRAERMPRGRGVDGWLEGAADLAVEVVEESEIVADVLDRARFLLGAGAQMVWVLDPGNSRVFVLNEPARLQELSDKDILEGGELLPGFSCPVAEIFG